MQHYLHNKTYQVHFSRPKQKMTKAKSWNDIKGFAKIILNLGNYFFSGFTYITLTEQNMLQKFKLELIVCCY